MDFPPKLRRKHASPADRLADLAEAFRAEIGDVVGSLDEPVASGRRAVARGLRSRRDAAGAIARDVGTQTRELIDHRPAASLGVAVVFGILVGFLLARR